MRADERQRVQLEALSRCGWPVRIGQRGWTCSAPWGHDHEHQLRLGGRVVARAAGHA